MPLSSTVLSPVFAFYNFYKECFTMSPPRSFWSLILCFNLLLSIFITIVRNLVSSLWSFHRHCTLQFLYSYSQPTHSSSNTIQNVFLTTCFLIVLAYFHLQSIRDTAEMFSQLLKFFLSALKFEENFKHSQFRHVSFNFLDRTMVLLHSEIIQHCVLSVGAANIASLSSLKCLVLEKTTKGERPLLFCIHSNNRSNSWLQHFQVINWYNTKG